jgi:hypothetical protein
MKRKYLRKRVQEVLKAAKIEGIGEDIYCRKSTSHDDNMLPFINIYPNSESASRYDEAPKRYKKFYDVTIEVITRHDTDDLLCDALDDLAYDIEQAIEGDNVLQGLAGESYDREGNCVEDTEQTSVQYDMQSDGSSPVGAVKLNYMISYVDQPSNKIARTPFSGVDIEYKIGDHGENKAIDNVELDQE